MGAEQRTGSWLNCRSTKLRFRDSFAGGPMVSDGFDSHFVSRSRGGRNEE